MLQPSKTAKTIEKTLLKTLLPFLTTNTDWQKWINLLARTSAVTFEKRQAKEKKPKCIVCAIPYDNYLQLILHLEIIHKQEIEVIKYEFTQDSLLISTRNIQEIDLNAARDFYAQVSQNEFTLLLSLKERSRQIMSAIFSKFCKRQLNHKKEYYHSMDVFREVGPDSQDQDSEAEVGKIEQQLQKMRISDFTDVNDNDKLFFMKWNDAVREAKKQHVYINGPVMRNLLKTFAATAKKEGLKRINLLMHAWTLWSTGKIDSYDVTIFLKDYDEAN